MPISHSTTSPIHPDDLSANGNDSRPTPIITLTTLKTAWTNVLLPELAAGAGTAAPAAACVRTLARPLLLQSLPLGARGTARSGRRLGGGAAAESGLLVASAERAGWGRRTPQGGVGTRGAAPPAEPGRTPRRCCSAIIFAVSHRKPQRNAHRCAQSTGARNGPSRARRGSLTPTTKERLDQRRALGTRVSSPSVAALVVCAWGSRVGIGRPLPVQRAWQASVCAPRVGPASISVNRLWLCHHRGAATIGLGRYVPALRLHVRRRRRCPLTPAAIRTLHTHLVSHMLLTPKQPAPPHRRNQPTPAAAVSASSSSSCRWTAAQHARGSGSMYRLCPR